MATFLSPPSALQLVDVAPALHGPCPPDCMWVWNPDTSCHDAIPRSRFQSPHRILKLGLIIGELRDELAQTRKAAGTTLRKSSTVHRRTQNRLRSAMSEVTHWKQKWQHEEGRVTVLQERVRTLQAELRAQDAHSQSLRVQLEHQSQRHKAARAQQAKALNTRYQKEVSELRRQCEDSLLNETAARMRAERLQEQLASAMQTQSKLEEATRAALKANDRLGGAVTKLNVELRETRETLNALHRDILQDRVQVDRAAVEFIHTHKVLQLTRERATLHRHLVRAAEVQSGRAEPPQVLKDLIHVCGKNNTLRKELMSPNADGDAPTCTATVRFMEIGSRRAQKLPSSSSVVQPLPPSVGVLHWTLLDTALWFHDAVLAMRQHASMVVRNSPDTFVANAIELIITRQPFVLQSLLTSMVVAHNLVPAPCARGDMEHVKRLLAGLQGTGSEHGQLPSHDAMFEDARALAAVWMGIVMQQPEVRAAFAPDSQLLSVLIPVQEPQRSTVVEPLLNIHHAMLFTATNVQLWQHPLHTQCMRALRQFTHQISQVALDPTKSACGARVHPECESAGCAPVPRHLVVFAAQRAALAPTGPHRS